MTASLNGDVKSIPIRCVIEERNEGQSCLNSSGSTVPTESENFAIVPSNTLFKDAVKTVLLKLGYSTHEASSAKGEVQIKNWRPLDLNLVSENEQATVEDMLGDLANIATLRIKIRPRSDDVKDKLLLMLLRQPYDVLMSKGVPISKDILERVVTGQDNLSPSILEEFYLWYNKQSTEESSQYSAEPNSTVSKSLVGAAAPSKTRLRISFSLAEVSKLQQWFDIDPQPTRQTMTKYLAELNDMPARKTGLKPLDLTNIMYWFKNARAALRRSGRSVASDDLSEDEGHPVQELSLTTVPNLPNSNAVYVIKNPIVKEDGDEKADENVTGHIADESDMEEDLSVTDVESEVDEKDTMELNESHSLTTDSKQDENEPVKPDSQLRVPSATSSPQLHSNFVQSVTQRMPGYPFPYGAFPMAYLQSQMHSNFYKDWSEKVQSAVAQAQQVNTAQQNMALMKADSIKAECELSKADRQKRHRAFIDPVSEIPKLEQWFNKDTHPSHYVIEQICDDLNRGEFRSRYPKLSPKNIQLWFKNHRAKVKRLRLGGNVLNFSDLDSSHIKMSPPHNTAMSMM